jgi:protein gp37
MNATGIAWTDVTWNPMSGCEKVSEGCKFCYAEALAETKRGTRAFPNGFELTFRPHKLAEPGKLKRPSLIFVNSMSDLFWEQIPDDYRDQVLDVIDATPQHQYQVLTKRPSEMLRYSRRRPLPGNFWAGVSIENQRNAGRLEILKAVHADVRFVSAEPLLGPLNLDLTEIHWLIAGGESGIQVTKNLVGQHRALVERVDGRWVPKSDACAWVQTIRDSCLRYGTKFFFKQWGGPRPASGGRLLDGRTWDEYPRLPIAANILLPLSHDQS